LRYREALGARHSSLVFQISFVATYHNGHTLVVLDPNDFFPQTRQLGERRSRGDAEDEQKPLACLHVKIPHGNWKRVSRPFLVQQQKRVDEPNCSVPAVSRLSQVSMAESKDREAF
jgi:hypothetical protein